VYKRAENKDSFRSRQKRIENRDGQNFLKIIGRFFMALFELKQ
jgi:hypothetical protein